MNQTSKAGSSPIAVALIAIALFAGAVSEVRGNIVTNFTGEYAVDNWTTSVSNGGDGSVNTGGAPGSIQLTSSNNAVGASNVDFTIAAGWAGLVSFNWAYTTSDGFSPFYDPFGYLLNGTFTQLTNNGGPNNQSGSSSFLVDSGDVFGFRQNSIDSIFGSATTTISNFTVAVPEPSSAFMVFGLVWGAFFSRKRRQIAA